MSRRYQEFKTVNPDPWLYADGTPVVCRKVAKAIDQVAVVVGRDPVEIARDPTEAEVDLITDCLDEWAYVGEIDVRSLPFRAGEEYVFLIPDAKRYEENRCKTS